MKAIPISFLSIYFFQKSVRSSFAQLRRTLIVLYRLATILAAPFYALNAVESELAPGEWPVRRLQNEIPSHRIVHDSIGPIRSLIYEGEAINGEATEVFAFYASPQTLGPTKPDNKVPGIVLIHGGGGTAFSDWVWMWANRGYAAIAMDLSGRRPPAPTYDSNGEKVSDFNHDKNQRIKLKKGGVDHTATQKFDSIGGTLEDDWPYHAVDNVMRAHTLLRSFPEVDKSRVAVTGTSWGGYTTCIVASIDQRFRAAAPVYGCGFLFEGESVQKPFIDRLGNRRVAWIEAYDPSSHLAHCVIPTFWVNGTHDKHYVLDSYAKSYALVKGPKTFRITHRMPHSHPAAWNTKEIGIYLDSILKNGIPLPRIQSVASTTDGVVTVTFSSEIPVISAKLHYTTETGPRVNRHWDSINASVVEEEAVARGLSHAANTWLMTLTDNRGAMISTEAFLK